MDSHAALLWATGNSNVGAKSKFVKVFTKAKPKRYKRCTVFDDILK